MNKVMILFLVCCTTCSTSFFYKFYKKKYLQHNYTDKQRIDFFLNNSYIHL